MVSCVVQDSLDIPPSYHVFYLGFSAASPGFDESAMQQYMPASEIRVVTFDLDNTLWRTAATIYLLQTMR